MSRFFYLVLCKVGRYHSYLQTSKKILSVYKGQQPFNIVLKDYFKKDKKYGSRDRKQISQLCYAWFRCSHLFNGNASEENIINSYFLVSSEPGDLLKELNSDLNEKVQLSHRERFNYLNCDPNSIFPFHQLLSRHINIEQFSNSFLQQPNLFARVRPGQHDIVHTKLEEAGIAYQAVSDDCLAFTNTTRLDNILDIDFEVVIQDRNSQMTGSLLMYLKNEEGKKIKVWDCCAASGGKSLMAFDLIQSIDLTVSDLRKTILFNLEKRLKKAGIAKFKIRELDLTNKHTKLPSKNFDLVIADVPCTGSGTWGRTPEQLAFFKPKRLEDYTSIQSRILDNTWPSLKPGGYLLYITCSVFAKENEEQVSSFCERSDALLVKMEYFEGYNDKADTLFASLLQKPL